MKYCFQILAVILCLNVVACAKSYQSKATSVLTELGQEDGKYPPLFEAVYNETKMEVDAAILRDIEVPIPIDMAGGYTHETHKLNYRLMQSAGDLYKLNGDRKYADYIKNVLVEYAKIYKSLPVHPTMKSYATGKLFWQCLNDANWMVYTSQAYDAIYDYLTEKERSYIEEEFLKPYADFISIENPQFFNRIHNHSTWGNAGVGMIALAIRDDALLQRALYGIKMEERDEQAKDNDGGYIYIEGELRAGFFAQIDYAFSPDGYYTEGPYYQRYAMLPFMAFAQALEEKRPDIKIFEYRDGLLVKAVKALLYQTNSEGEFFPMNDAAKGMSIKANSVVTAVDIAYSVSKDEVFLEAARLQGTVLLNQLGLEIARELEAKPNGSFKKGPMELTDGKDGDEGAIGILRNGIGKNEMNVVFKYTSQGLGHGHYDKLSYSLFDGPTEVLQDFGAARWVNIDQKAGGRYLKENNTWAKQTISHNTLVVDEKSHFNGEYAIANINHSDPVYFDANDINLQVACAKEVNAYDGVEMHRALILWTDPYFNKPLVIDVFSVKADAPHQYDMPYQHAGQIMSQNFDYIAGNPTILGKSHGYQHVYQEAIANPKGDNIQMNWMKDNNFYTMTTIAEKEDEIILARAGATDPEFNIRKDPFLIHRKKDVKNTTFVSVIESHGIYSTVTEVPLQPYSKVESVKLEYDNYDYSVIEIRSREGKTWQVMLAKYDGNKTVKHSIKDTKRSFQWTGPIKIIEVN